ncbi:hypothetical protein BSFA1_79620 (plasmid) [Burkholderia sp. SFA1]|nr:hypothetical protein BYI23_E000690 [Burkholderia sp. YI23]BBQ02834.1 hypothetical protein BSFA1_79620 [Burkholderia sp. SFA1]
MSKLIRVFDALEAERRFNLVIREDGCPGLLEFLAEMPFRTETPLMRGIVYQWFIKHREAGTLDEAINEALEGPGGLIEAVAQARQPKKAPSRARGTKVVRQRSINARPTPRPALSDSSAQAQSLPPSIEVPQAPEAISASSQIANAAPRPPVLPVAEEAHRAPNQPIHLITGGEPAAIAAAPMAATTGTGASVGGGDQQPIQMPNLSELDAETLSAMDGLDNMFS